MGELWFRCKEFFRFSRRESRDIFIAILVLTFAFAFDDGRETFQLGPWLANLIKTLLFVSIAMLGHVSMQKVFALQQGFLAEFRGWTNGLVATVIVTLLTLGDFYFLLPGGLVLYHMTILRIGKWRYGENVAARGMIAISGPVANLIIASFGIMMASQLGVFPEFFQSLAMVNLWIMFYTLLPIPYLDGIHLFFWSRLTYVFVASTLLAYVILSSVEVYSWFLSLVTGLIVWFLYYVYGEQ